MMKNKQVSACWLAWQFQIWDENSQNHNLDIIQAVKVSDKHTKSIHKNIFLMIIWADSICWSVFLQNVVSSFFFIFLFSQTFLLLSFV